MKKVISLLLIAVLAIAMAIPVGADASTGEKQGVIKAFSEKSITLGVAGKNYTYTIDSKTIVKRIDQEVDLMEVARKGIKVTFKSSGSKLTYINIPNIGAEMQGTARIAVSDFRINVTDSSLAADSTTSTVDAETGEVIQTIVTKVKEVDAIDCDEYAYEYDQIQVILGDINIVDNKVKVVLNGKEVKVIDEAASFDPTTLNDEVKLFFNTDYSKKCYALKFEANITDNKDAEQQDVEKILKVNYKKKMYEIATTETSFLPVDADGLVELNGKETTLVKAITMSNYWFARTNPEGAVIHADGFYRDVEAVFTGLSQNQIKVNIVKNGKVVGSESLTLSAGVTIQAADGRGITAKDLKVNDKIILTTEPADGYKVTFIKKK